MKSVFLDVFEDSRLQICKPHSAFNPEIFFKGAMHKMPPLDVVVVQCMSCSTAARASRQSFARTLSSKYMIVQPEDAPPVFPCIVFFSL